MAIKLCLNIVSVWITAQILSSTSAFTISGNGTGTNGETVSQSANLKLTCTSTRDDIRYVEWFKKTRGDSNYKISPSVLVLIKSDGTCEFDTTYTIPANIKCDCVNISMYTCTLISVQANMKGDMWRCRFTYGTPRRFSFTNNLTIDLAVGITSANITSPIINPVSVIVNTTIIFECQTSTGRPEATIAWYKNNTTPATQITSHTDTSSKQQGDLFVTHGNLTLNVQRDDQALGVYCRASNGGQWFTSETKEINVLYGPKMRTLKDISVVQWEKFEYPCLYEPGNPPAVSFEWTRSESIASWIKQEKQNLTISTVQRSDEANYTCNVSSILGATLTLKYDTATFHLNVVYGAENLKILLNNVSNASVEIEENTTNHLQCSLESDPASNIIILKDGKTITESHGVHQLTHEIKSECSDTGVYTCSGYNEYGAAENASICLFVKCSARQPPGVVVRRNYTARQGDNVTMSYTIVAYPVPKPSQFVWKRCTYESDDSCNVLSDSIRKSAIATGNLSSSLTILDVKKEDYGMYQFSVHNDIGSQLIEWLHLKPIRKPDRPSEFHVIQEEISETSAVLTWVPGFDNGSPQTFYITYWKKGDSSGRITKSVEHKYEGKINYTLGNLETETEYIASINASNKEGSTTTINDITFITLKHIPGKQADFPVALIGGSAGGGIATVLVIIGVIFIVKKFRTSGNTKHRGKLIKGRMNQHSSQQQDDAANPDGQSVSGTDSPECRAALTYEDLSRTTDASDYDALKAGDNGSGTASSSCKAAQTYEELSTKTDTSVYDALKKGEHCHDNSQVYTPLDESNSNSHNYYGNVKKEDPVYINTVL